MPRVAPIVPADSDILCEGCGYTLNGLPPEGNCPECGRAIGHSVGSHRQLSEFESNPSAATFIITTLAVLLAPRRFYARLTTRAGTPAAEAFAGMNIWIATALFMFAIVGHAAWVVGNFAPTRAWVHLAVLGAIALLGFPVLFVLLASLARLTAWLSALEARYWGMRLPQPVVLRALRFHAASYLPVSLLAVAIVWGYRWLLVSGTVGPTSMTWYLYTLCAAVIVSAAYLFRMYWIAMKSMMYANR